MKNVPKQSIFRFRASQTDKRNLLIDGLFIGLVFLAAYLHFSNLASNPGWYSAEGSDLDIARHLMAGRFQYLAINGTPLESVVCRCGTSLIPSFENATFVVVDKLWCGWAVDRIPPLGKYIQTVEAWSRVVHQGEFDVYRNPAH